MADELDPRILRIGIEVAGRLKIYEGLEITASGTKYANPNQNECEVKISNLDKQTHDYLLTETSPFNLNRVRKKLIVEAGRKSTGASLVYEGDIVSAVGSQPPDIQVVIKAKSGDFDKGNVVARSKGGKTPLSAIARSVASDLGVKLDFQATEKQIANYSHSGAALKQVDRLQTTGAVNAYVNNGVLVVKDFNIPLKGKSRVLDLDKGMIGIPQFTEQGVKVRMLFDNQTDLGYGLDITSIMNPAADGEYVVYKLGFELANRDTPWYLTAEATRRDGLVNPNGAFGGGKSGKSKKVSK